MDEQLDDPSDDLTAEVTVADGTAVVCLVGEIDIASRAIVIAACNDAIAGGARHVVLDMSAVTFMDSSGIAALIETHSVATVSLRKPSEAVQRLLEATGLGGTFEVES